ncbi:DNA-3-methyladenine glycosylase II [Halanaerobium saccharolyticum]|uniref:Methylated-DNA--protein-cysteine methyltransferase n=1 Tax=Halanaerobium saccharolyticum TaxID=43595 RepID=A0A4R6LPR0_9FIRM|nr:methylated-DNA--[protein]-cysteine S-methyltransferase [Halanaerobium saccharolyticum]TDO89312.1 DNA-3-methyladenine glycosylase II [Halanaerobium saccharolyticum]
MKNKIVISQSEIDYLKNKDQRMNDLINYIGEIEREYIPEPFTALANSIVYQQLSAKAADSIWNKLKNLIPKLTPENIAAAADSDLKKCGLSKRKIDYLKNLAAAVNQNQLELSKLEQIEAQTIIDQLVKIKGIGSWTAEMFLIFSLNRKNVISYNDLGIRKGIQWFYGLKSEPTEKQFKKFKDQFDPFNTAASLYLWEVTTQNLDQIFNSAKELTTENKVAYYDSPVGLVEVQADKDKIVSLDFKEEKRYQEAANPVLLTAKKQLDQYFKGERKVFELPLEIEGTEFQQSVWQQLLEIPYGNTFSYKEVAEAVGNNKAYRAVGNANNKNRFPIIIPCHRVTASNGDLGGYGSGVWRKKWLLQHEKENL